MIGILALHLDRDEKRMKAEIQRAEKEADITVIMPQMGVEYRLEPTDEQVKLYHKMIDWGADIIFGGHPHVDKLVHNLNNIFLIKP